MVSIRVETRSGHSGQPDHVLSRLSGSDLVYRICGSDQDSASHALLMVSLLIKVMN